MRKLLFILLLFPFISWGQFSTILGYSSPATFTYGLEIHDIQFLDAMNGWACADSGTIVHTTNGGLSWSDQLSGTWGSGPTEDLYRIHMVDMLHGYAVGDYGLVMKTIDGGTTWLPTSGNVPSTVTRLEAIHFLDDMTGYVAGDESDTWGFIAKTIDGGDTWTQQFSMGTTDWFLDMTFTDATHGWAVGQGGVYHTSDGTSWSQQYDDDLTMFESIQMEDGMIGSAVGTGGKYIRTFNGGLSWNAVVTSETDTLRDHQFVDGNYGIAVGYNGSIAVASYFGLAWLPYEVGPPSYDFLSLEVYDWDNIFIGTENGLIYRFGYRLTDAVVVDVPMPSVACEGQTFSLEPTVRNDGIHPLTDMLFTVTDDFSTLFSYNWSGVIPPDSSLTIYIGEGWITASSNINVSVVGDTLIGPENIFSEYITLAGSVAHGIEIQSEPPCEGDSIHLKAFGGDSYNWLISVPEPLLSTISVPFVGDDVIYCEIYQGDCVFEDSAVITMATDCDDPGPDVYTNYAFSPNGDSKNDYLFLNGLDSLQTNGVKIFNRWGDQVWSVDDYINESSAWDGMAANGPDPGPGTYYYIHQVAGEFRQAGWIQLVR